jgi:hypothetical protein
MSPSSSTPYSQGSTKGETGKDAHVREAKNGGGATVAGVDGGGGMSSEEEVPVRC